MVLNRGAGVVSDRDRVPGLSIGVIEEVGPHLDRARPAVSLLERQPGAVGGVAPLRATRPGQGQADVDGDGGLDPRGARQAAPRGAEDQQQQRRERRTRPH